jgi:hypothetical protein
MKNHMMKNKRKRKQKTSKRMDLNNFLKIKVVYVINLE